MSLNGTSLQMALRPRSNLARLTGFFAGQTGALNVFRQSIDLGRQNLLRDFFLFRS